MKVGRFEESNKDSDEMIERAIKLKDEFGEDYAVVATKFYVQQASIKFILRDYQKAKESANLGISLCAEVKEEDLEIKRSVNNAKRDLMNVLLRSTVKLDPSKDSATLRKEMA